MSHFLASERDSEYQHRDQLLRDSELRYRQLFEAAPDGILIVDARSGIVADVNPALLAMLAYSRAELVDRKVWELAPFAERMDGPESFQTQWVHAPHPALTTLRANDGRSIVVSLSTHLLNLGSARVLHCTVQILADSLHSETALRESIAQTTLILDNALDAVITIDARGLVTRWNTQAERSFGWASHEVLGRLLADLILPERYRAAHTQGLARFLAGGEGPMLNRRIELSALHRDGREFPVEITIAQLSTSGVISFNAFLRDITARKHAEAELQRRTEEFKALADTAHDLAGERDLDTLLQTILDRSRDLMGVFSGAIYLYDPERKDLAIAFVRGLMPYVGSRLPLGEGAAGRAALTRQPLVINDYANWPGQSAMYKDIDVHAIICVPMIYRTELIGVLTAIELAGSTRSFTAAESQLLSLFADQAASAVHNARALEQARRRAAQLQTLNEVSQSITGALEQGPLMRQVVTALRSVLELYYVSIAIVEGDELVYLDGASREPTVMATLPPERLKISAASISGWVAQHGQTLLVPDVSAEPRYHRLTALPAVQSELIVPLRIHNKVIGVLDATSDRLNAFTSEHVNLVEALAVQAAVAIYNAQLFAETRARLAELEAVSRVNAALRTAPTVEAMLPLLLQVTLDVLHVSQGSIWLYDATDDMLHSVATHGFGPAFGDPSLPPMPPGMGLAGIVYASGEPVISREFATDPRVPESSRDLTPRGVGGAGVPIRAADTVIGTFFVRVALPRVVTTAEVRLLATLSEIAGNAIQRISLRLQTERRLRYLTALSEIDRVISSSFELQLSLSVLLAHVTTQLAVDAADVLLFNNGTQMLEYAAGRGFRGKHIERTRVRLGEGVAGRAVMERRLTRYIVRPDNAEPPAQADPQRAQALGSEGFVDYFCVPLLAKGKLKGVLEAYRRVVSEPDDEWLDFLKSLGERAAIAIDNVTLFDGLQRSNNELVLAYDATIEGWARALELRDRETEGHTRRAADITVSLAREFGMSDDELVQVRWGALLHDIGKMGIPDNILLKPGPLTAEEWQVMQTHPLLAYDMLSPIRYLRAALDIPFRHHEKWDGSGYPRALKGEQIPISARIFAVVDVWDALRSDRPYRAGWSEAATLAHIQAGAGTHFDPDVVQRFLQMQRSRQPEPDAQR